MATASLLAVRSGEGLGGDSWTQGPTNLGQPCTNVWPMRKGRYFATAEAKRHTFADLVVSSSKAFWSTHPFRLARGVAKRRVRLNSGCASFQA